MDEQSRSSFAELYHSLITLEAKDLQMAVLFCHLLLMAKKKKTTSYRTPAQAMGMFSAGLGGHLEELFKMNLENRDPLYGSLVVNAGSGIPSAGFFGAAKRTGLLNEDASESEQKEFWERQKERTFASMASDDLRKLIAPLSDIQKAELFALLKCENFEDRRVASVEGTFATAPAPTDG